MNAIRWPLPDTYPRLYVQFLHYFNVTRDYYECHEVLEELWLEEGRNPFYQGLLQVAVALYHFRNDNRGGAIKLFRSALEKLDAFPKNSLGINLEKVRDDTKDYLQRLEQYDAHPFDFYDLHIHIQDPELQQFVEKEGKVMRLQGKKVACLVDHEFEDLELWGPIMRCREEGAEVHLVGPEANRVYKGKYGVPAESDRDYSRLRADEYDGVLIPGGWAPDKIRRSPDVQRFIRDMDEANKPIGQICHAGWVLISARILDGRKVTSTPGIRDDMENAGATWVDEEVVIDGNLVSSRRPPDIPRYARAFVDLLAAVEDEYSRGR